MTGDEKSYEHDHDSQGETVLREESGKDSNSPFNGTRHSEHPRDPFRDLFGDNRFKFEF